MTSRSFDLATLLAYGYAELAAFRQDMADLDTFIGGDMGEAHSGRQQHVCRELRAVIRKQDARRNAAGFTREQAARAVVLAAEEGRAL